MQRIQQSYEMQKKSEQVEPIGLSSRSLDADCLLSASPLLIIVFLQCVPSNCDGSAIKDDESLCLPLFEQRSRGFGFVTFKDSSSVEAGTATPRPSW